MAKDKILSFIVCVIMIIMFFCNSIVFAAENENVFKVEQVTSVEEINSKNLYQYILVHENSAGVNYAFAATLASNSNEMSSRSNWSEVTIENDKLTLVDTRYPNIVWNLTKSKASVLEEGDYPVLQSASNINSDTKRNQIELSDDGGYPGIRFSDNGNGFTFVETSDNKFKIYENNCNSALNYLSFNTYFEKSTEANAVEFKVYKILKNYNYTSSKFLTNEEVAALDNVTVSKNVSESVNYKDTAIAEVTLSTNGTNYEKVCDIILMLDDSTSVYNPLPNNTEKTRAQVIREDALLFSKELLNINSQNRVSVIKFGANITNEADVDRIGFSNKIEDIQTMIGGDKTEVSYGTNYTSAFRKANEVFEKHSDSSRGKVVIFISDGMPSLYNGISFEMFENTADSTGIANNWINYLNNTVLGEAELMKETGVAIYTIGSLEDDTSMNHSEGYIIPAGTTRNILSKIATHDANFYKFDEIATELENILDNLLKDFCYSPTDAVVIDKLTSDIDLLTKNVSEYIPKIVFKKGDTEIETITFNEDGTEAYSSLKPDVNILNGKKFEGEYISFDGNAIKWNIGQLYKYTYKLEFPIYLNKTVNTYGDGTSRETGDYKVSDTTSLTYTSVTNEEIKKDFENTKLPWVSSNTPNKNQSTGSTGQSSTTIGNANASAPAQPNQTVNQATVVETGDNVPQNMITIIAIVVILNVWQYKSSKNKVKIRNHRGTAYCKKNNRKPRIERILHK